MKVNPKDVSTIVILSKNKQSAKTIQVRTKHIVNLKFYALSLVGVVALLVGAIVLLRSNIKQQEVERQSERQLLLNQIVHLKGQIPAVLQAQSEKTRLKATFRQLKKN
ncbi:hypothetical protein [Mucilaginibacter antarcticus]|uniref:hypothetical protein n=1 Tax=Mucilaginibacter antarcticus TaxID=1855725 RepID=UPI003642EBCD